MFCPKCGAELKEGDKFCPECGTPYSPPSPPATAKKRYCVFCGAEMPTEGNFCPKCGKRRVFEREIKEERIRRIEGEQAPQGAARIILYILSFFIPIIGIIIGIIYWLKPSKEAKVFGRNCVIIAIVMPVLFILSAIIVAFIFGIPSEPMPTALLTAQENSNIAGDIDIVHLGGDVLIESNIRGQWSSDNGVTWIAIATADLATSDNDGYWGPGETITFTAVDSESIRVQIIDSPSQNLMLDMIIRT